MPYACPLCGATSNRKGKPFDDAQNVVFHIDSKCDDVHRDESGAVLRDDIEFVEDTSSDTTTDVPTTSTDIGAATQQRETVDLTPEELDEALEEARQESYEEGVNEGIHSMEVEMMGDDEIQQLWNDAYEEGYQDAKDELDAGGSAGQRLEPHPLPCGHEHIDPVQVLRHTEMYTVCETCGEQYEGTVYD